MRGRATGIRGRGGITADVAWDLASGSFRATLTSVRDQQLQLRLPAAAGAVTITPGDAAQPGKVPGQWALTMRAGMPLCVTGQRG